MRASAVIQALLTKLKDDRDQRRNTLEDRLDAGIQGEIKYIKILQSHLEDILKQGGLD